MSLVVKKQKAINDWLCLRINCSKQCTCEFFRGRNASRKAWSNDLDVLKHQKTYGLFLGGLNDIEKGIKFLEVRLFRIKIGRTKFNWCA